MHDGKHPEVSTPGKSDNRTSPVLGLHISGKRVYRPSGLFPRGPFRSQFVVSTKACDFEQLDL
jgi:hypothetical protein